ncbi:MAG: sel1 repeat family protein [Bacilli bacterium]|nr:sel1 repeat family protein [Bacilli bacterium]
MKKYIKLNNNDNHLSWGNLTRIIKENTINKTSALQTEIFCIIFNIPSIGDTTVNNYCTGARSINDEYKQIYLTYKKKYNNNKNILLNTITNLLSIIEGTIYNTYNIDNINNSKNLKNICLKLYNISKNDKYVPNELSSNLNNLITNNNLYEAIVEILFFIILEKKQPIYEENIKKEIIENILSNTDISSNELEEYLNLKFNEGINYNYSLKKLAQNKNTYALYEMGINEYKGYIKGYPRYNISYKYFKEASIKNHPGSYYMISKMYYDKLIGTYSNEELKEAYNYLIKAVELNNIPGMNLLGLLYLNGIYPVKKDINKAIEYFKLASSNNYAYAYNNLGKIYENKKDYKKALDYYQKSSLLGESWALNKLGEYYRLGICVEKDIQKAFDYYNEAIDSPIESTCYHAYYNLAKYFYLTNNTIKEKNINTAIEYLTISSKHNHIKSSILLLYIYIEDYIKNKSNITLNKIKELTNTIENHKEYNSKIKQDIENNLKKIKEDNKINLDIIL